MNILKKFVLILLLSLPYTLFIEWFIYIAFNVIIGILIFLFKNTIFGINLSTIVIVLLIVSLIRTFFIAPFRLPSGSMKPNLLIGDFILVSKYSYGYYKYALSFFNLEKDLHKESNFLKKINKKLNKDPERGDVIVFRHPDDTSINYIKRVIGLPEDRIEVKNNFIYINGKKVPQENLEDFFYDDITYKQMKEDDKYDIIHINPKATSIPYGPVTIPEDKYFVLGDNRHYSNDSIYWGYVPKENIIGKAQYIWFSWSWGNSKLRYKRFFTKII